VSAASRPAGADGATSAIAARIAALTVHPVKGCGAIAVKTATAEVTGLRALRVRDREWMVVDAAGRFLTQREHPRLSRVVPSVDDASLRLAAPNAAPLDVPLAPSQGLSSQVVVWRSHVLGIDQGDAAAAWFSDYLGKRARLVRFDPAKPRRCNPDYVGTTGAHTMFADGYPVLVVGQASLDDLNARLAAKGSPALPMNRFRPNVVVAGLPPYDEDHLDTIDSGGVTLKLVKPCVRCQVTTTDQATARVGIEPLATLGMYRRDDALAGVTFGMNAIVVAGAGRPLEAGAAATVTYRF